MSEHVCRWWYAYGFDNALRRHVHDPRTLLGGWVREGMTAVDVGCGMGHFSIGMARLVGESGSVIAVDLQQKMLDVLHKRALKAGLDGRIRLHRCAKDTIGLDVQADFALAFYMVHEVPSAETLFKELHAILKSEGRLLLVEPKFHVSESQFSGIYQAAQGAGFRMVDEPRIRMSRTALFAKS